MGIPKITNKPPHRPASNPMTCKCEGVEFGEYTNTIMLGWYPAMDSYRKRREDKYGDFQRGVCVDLCIVRDVVNLWEAGIETHGSCCGHNKAVAMINIDPKKYEQALAMGYGAYVFGNDPDRKDTVIPRSMMEQSNG